MTEIEWLTGEDPQAMLRFLQRGPIATARKLRLFACACCRQVWDGVECPGIRVDGPHDLACQCAGTGLVGGLTDPRSRRAVEVAERYADGSATEEERENALRAASDAVDDCDRPDEKRNFAFAAMAQSLVRRDVWSTVRSPRPWPPAALQAAILRDVLGNPFRPAPSCCGQPKVCAELKRWLTWNDGTVPRLAQAVCDERAFDRLPILADALEDAGCTGADLLGHCRAGGTHVRGCWALDLLLGKE